MSLPLTPGDVVTVNVDRTWIDTRPANRPYSLTGLVYARAGYQNCLWVGRVLVVKDGVIRPWITVALVVPAAFPHPAAIPSTAGITQDRPPLTGRR